MNRTSPKLFLTAILAATLTGCGAAGGGPTPTPGPEPDFVPVVSATGEVVPIQWAELSLPIGGIVESLPVVEGDEVATGGLLLQLSGREALEAALAAARLEQIAAQQELDRVHDEEALARAQAQDALATARDELREAEYIFDVRQEGNRASEDTIDGARARLSQAKEKYEDAKDAFDRADSTGARARAYDSYASAKAAYNTALANYNWYTGHPTEIQQAMLDADVAIAKAKVEVAQAAWDDVKDGIDPDVLSLAEARLDQATTAVAAAEGALADSELRAPFAGTVGLVRTRPNEWISPGQSLVDLADLSSFQIQTSDLSEIDAARVALDAPVTVTFDALPEVVVPGHVARIAPRASEGSGVNYTVWIQLDEIPEGLMWGMTAFVDIEAAP